ncbi:cytochrome c family protein [Nordella sp. HKS 07]|uniref:c-type cytochrome n=1 Tax=Nordella sp. HKS 07 TaxID=2712222 RepID=UPI0013E14929|nr:cytochrome c family protein [Nordella sp. HKS 07]QIG48849.1 cytochrome c family protein [Nordella sp. HKS 07]
MNSFEFNKIAGALLATALVVFGLNQAKSMIYHAEKPDKQGYAIEVAATGSGETGGGTAVAESLGTLLAKADPAKGQAQAKACLACHSFEKGGPNKTGPDLWDVVERPIAAHEGFAYSDSLKEHASDKWSFENLNKFITNPKGFAPKTKMTFGGIKRDQARADLLAYLRTLSDSPKPLPAP